MYISSLHLGVMVGLLLGDAYLRRGSGNSNARILFGQSLINFPYFWFVFTIMSPYCANLPYLDSSVIKGVRHYRVMLSTRTYPVLNALYDMFYTYGVKVVPQEIYHLLSPVALAH